MTVVEWTAVATVLLALVGSVAIPVWLQRRKAQADASSTTVLSWQGLTESIQKERDDLRTQIDGLRDQLGAIDVETRRRAREIESDWEQRMVIAKLRITDLEIETVKLRRLLAAEPDTRT